MSQSAVSRQVSALEQDLGVPLFHRHARGLILTEQGEHLFRAAHDVLVKLEAVRSRLTDSPREADRHAARHHHRRPRLDLADAAPPRIHRPLSATSTSTCILDDEELDLAMRQADVAIRLRQPIQPDLIQRRLFTVHMHLYAVAGVPQALRPPAIDRGSRQSPPLVSAHHTPYLQRSNWLVEVGRDDKGPRKPQLRSTTSSRSCTPRARPRHRDAA